MARQRTIKYPPKRGKFTKRQIQRAVDKVVYERLERESSSPLEAIANALDIPESYYEQATKRYKSIGAWLERDESVVACYKPEIYPQGSFLLGTVIKPVSGAEEYDIDLVSELSLQKTEISQEKLKCLVGDEIKSYARANDMYSRPEESKHCWTLNYADGAQFHINILPTIPDAESFKQLIESYRYVLPNGADSTVAITDNTLSSYSKVSPDWPHSNPKGYTEWFRSCMQVQFDVIRKSFAESIQRRVEEVPGYKVKTPLQRTIQILKRHRDIWFNENQSAYDEKAKPLSIIITTLAAQVYDNEADLQRTLLKIVGEMSCHIKYDSNGMALIPNPVNPLENFAGEWQEHPIRKTCFTDWLMQAQLDLTQALELSNIQSVGKSLKSCLGGPVINEGLRNLSQAGNHPASTLATTPTPKSPMCHEANR
ncbi:MAG: nucleotidyltransferase [Candidatus Poribacteria bacterium]|nr:nucleotidyltransferase [Candidatus Poribacteria bacterium]MDE0466222.1 nucleotidyltransferase [Candidatus Poribacteria bacterium]